MSSQRRVSPCSRQKATDGGKINIWLVGVFCGVVRVCVSTAVDIAAGDPACAPPNPLSPDIHELAQMTIPSSAKSSNFQAPFHSPRAISQSTSILLPNSTNACHQDSTFAPLLLLLEIFLLINLLSAPRVYIQMGCTRVLTLKRLIFNTQQHDNSIWGYVTKIIKLKFRCLSFRFLTEIHI